MSTVYSRLHHVSQVDALADGDCLHHAARSRLEGWVSVISGGWACIAKTDGIRWAFAARPIPWPLHQGPISLVALRQLAAGVGVPPTGVERLLQEAQREPGCIVHAQWRAGDR